VKQVHTIPVNGSRLRADVSGALIWPERATLVVADLHLEKGSSYGARGRHVLPPYDSTATLDRLEAVLSRHRPDRVICLGDSFHDEGAARRLPEADRARLQAMTAAHEWIWIAGNHDPEPPADLGGDTCEDLCLGGLVFRHAAAPSGGCAGEISGHYHPKASVRLRGRRISAHCFVGDGRRLVMPAFGAYTGGLNVLAAPIQNLFPTDFAAHLLGKGGVYPYRRATLVA
jgi:hypothetical protein